MSVRLWLILVEPDADEADRVTPGQVDAGEAWLDRGLAEGYVTTWNSYANDDGTPRTGGFMVVVAVDRAALAARLSTYPLLDTIADRLDIRPLNARGGDGFAVLRADVATRRRAQTG